MPPKEIPLIFHDFAPPQKVGIQALRRVTAELVKLACLMKIKVFAQKGCKSREMRIWCLPGGLKILCNCMQFACNVVRTFQGLNHEFNTPAGGLAAWWRIETWAREGSIALIPPHGTAAPGKTGLTTRSIELYRDFRVEKVAFSRTFSKKHKR